MKVKSIESSISGVFIPSLRKTVFFKGGVYDTESIEEFDYLVTKPYVEIVEGKVKPIETKAKKVR